MMCWLSRQLGSLTNRRTERPESTPESTPESKPDWITQSREEVAQAERDAAAIHYTYMQLIEDGLYPDGTALGDYAHQRYWWLKHLEAAWYTENPEV